MSKPDDIPRRLWEHPRPESTEMYKFMQGLNEAELTSLKTFQDLYHYSVSERSRFWHHLFQFLRPIHSGSYTRVIDDAKRMDEIPLWFEGVKINFAENLLFRRGPGTHPSSRDKTGKEDDKVAVTEVREGGTEIRHITWRRLRSDVARLGSAMRGNRVEKGDRIAVVASNSYDTLLVCLAATSVGAIFSTSSTDMGVKGILDRLCQVKPKFLFADDWSVYNGKTTKLLDKIVQVVKGIQGDKGYRGVVLMPRFAQPESADSVPSAITLEQFLAKATSSEAEFEPVDFASPLLIAYSSGTTGDPKCIAHSTGGALLSLAKETILHSELSPESVVLQYTTTGWIMYFSTIMNLFVGARTILYDGSPFQPDATAFIKLIGDQKVTRLGTSPRWMAEIQRAGLVPKEITDLSSLTSVCSTGMVLSERQFRWCYDVAFPPTIHLANISGGTDMAGCYGLENPLTPLYVGGCQGPSLGTPIAVYDSQVGDEKGVQGQSMADGTLGELVITHAFPNMPAYFWNDAASPPSRDSKYFRAYFEKYDNAWTQGDLVTRHPATGQVIILGRADGVLNPSGVRFGSAEIYSVLEQYFEDRISDSVCVGQRRPDDEDEAVMLFVLMKAGVEFSQRLCEEIRAAIRKALSARHVPKYIFETPEIPVTVNLKKVEQPVKQIVSGSTIKPSGTLLNPDCLKFYYRFARVEDVVGVKARI